MSWGNRFAPYISVAERKEQAAKEVQKLNKKGQKTQPIIVNGRTIAKTFWGKAWCDNLGSYSDYENRLPRGRTYVRNGSVIDLQISNGEINALVSGSSIYKVKISLSPINAEKWQAIVNQCSGKIDSLIELLQGKFSKGVMEIMTNQKTGLFPDAKELKMNCSCPDWASMCKHIAAVLYGIGSRLDEHPEELFLLRQANHLDLITKADTTSLIKKNNKDKQIIQDSDLSSLFGIDMTGNAKEETTSKSKLKKNKAKSKAEVKSEPKSKTAIKKAAKKIKSTTINTIKQEKTAAKKSIKRDKTIKKAPMKKAAKKKASAKKESKAIKKTHNKKVVNKKITKPKKGTKK